MNSTAISSRPAGASDVGGGLGAASKVLRLLLQSAILAVGAWLVINQQSTPGIIIAGSILGARALAPVDLAIANWRGFVAARQSWQRLSKLLGHLPAKSDPMPLKPPVRSLVVQNGAVGPPGVQKIVCQDVNITLAAGKALGVIGPTASGKSSLARMLVGVWRPARGTVRLDGATLDQWSSEALGRHVGYVPQDVELFNGTVAQNICRFEDPPDPDAVIAAAQAAGVHDLIINLPEGYDTVIGEHGSALSAGQAQRIALARALYRDPFLVVLDEPNSNLDAEGDEALTRAILGLRARGAITVVIAHRPSAIAGVDYILVMAKGRQQQFGPKEEILSRVVPATTAPRLHPQRDRDPWSALQSSSASLLGDLEGPRREGEQSRPYCLGGWVRPVPAPAPANRSAVTSSPDRSWSALWWSDWVAGPPRRKSPAL